MLVRRLWSKVTELGRVLVRKNGYEMIEAVANRGWMKIMVVAETEEALDVVTKVVVEGRKGYDYQVVGTKIHKV